MKRKRGRNKKNNDILRFYTWNSNLRFSSETKIQNILKYFAKQDADIIFLQEIGLLTPDTYVPSEVLGGFTLFSTSCEETLIRNHTSAVLLSTHLSPFISDVTRHCSGRAVFVTLQFSDKRVGIASVYMPQGTQVSGGALKSRAGIEGVSLVEEVLSFCRTVDIAVIGGGLE